MACSRRNFAIIPITLTIYGFRGKENYVTFECLTAVTTKTFVF